MKILIASMAFVLPAIPLSALGGEIADSHDKAAVARRLKFAEIFVQAIGAAGFALSSLTLLYLALFGLGCIAALFGPIKYGILPGPPAARGTGRRQRAGRGRDLRRHHLRPDRRRPRRGERSLDARRRHADDDHRGRLLRDVALHPADRSRRARPQGPLERVRLDLADHRARSAPTAASGPRRCRRAGSGRSASSRCRSCR